MTRYLVEVASGVELAVLAKNGAAPGAPTPFVPDDDVRLIWPDAAVRVLTPQQQPAKDDAAVR
jgi:hypothetical protein